MIMLKFSPHSVCRGLATLVLATLFVGVAAAEMASSSTPNQGDNVQPCRPSFLPDWMPWRLWAGLDPSQEALKTCSVQSNLHYALLKDKYWPPFEPNAIVIAGSIIVFIGAALANAGGVGGGGLFVPMFNLFLGYDAKTSTALSKSMVMGGAIASVIFNIQLKHPHKDGPIIDYPMARLMQPALLLGISVGVTLNVIFPPWLITVLLCVLLFVMTQKTLEKGFSTWRKEQSTGYSESPGPASRTSSEANLLPAVTPELLEPPRPEQGDAKPNQHSDPSPSEGETTFLPPKSGISTQDIESSVVLVEEGTVQITPAGVRGEGEERVGGVKDEAEFVSISAPGSETEIGQLLEGGGGSSSSGAVTRIPGLEGGLEAPLLTHRRPRLRHQKSLLEQLHIGTPRKVNAVSDLVDLQVVGELTLVWLCYLALQITRQLTEDCSPAFWVLDLAQIPVTAIATWTAFSRMLGRAKGSLPPTSSSASDVLPLQQPVWQLSELLAYPLASLIAGINGGLLGIGGGMVLGPVMLHLNLPPQVVSATSTFMVIFSSSLSVVEFYLLGRIPTEVALYFCAIAIVAAFVGLSIVRAIVTRSGKASIIIFMLGLVIGTSGIILGAMGGARIVEDWASGAPMGFRSYCSRKW